MAFSQFPFLCWHQLARKTHAPDVCSTMYISHVYCSVPLCTVSGYADIAYTNDISYSQTKGDMCPPASTVLCPHLKVERQHLPQQPLQHSLHEVTLTIVFCIYLHWAEG